MTTTDGGQGVPSSGGAEEINRFLTHLAVDGHVSASAQNQAFCALRFLYRDVLRVDPGADRVEHGRGGRAQ